MLKGKPTLFFESSEGRLPALETTNPLAPAVPGAADRRDGVAALLAVGVVIRHQPR